MISVPSTDILQSQPSMKVGFFPKMRLEDPGAGTDHVAFMETVEGHMFNLSLISRNLFVMGPS